MRTITQYAYGILGERKGPWRLWYGEAQMDALRDGSAQRELHSNRIYMIVPAEIVCRRIEPTPEQLSQLQRSSTDPFHQGRMVQLRRHRIVSRIARDR